MATSSDEVRVVAERLVALGEPLLDVEPHASATLVLAACLLDEGLEVAVPGPSGATLAAARRCAPPFCVLAFGDGPLPLLEGRKGDVLYVCHRGACEAPVAEPGSVTAALIAAATWEADS